MEPMACSPVVLSTVGYGQEVPGHCMNGAAVARCRESGTAAAEWLLSCACQGLTQPGLPGPAYLASPCNNGREGRTGLRLCCAPCSNKGSGMALSDLFRLLSQWHWCSEPVGAEMPFEYCRPAAGMDRPSGSAPMGIAAMVVAALWRSCCFVFTTYICRRTRFLFSCACLAESLFA